MSRKKTEKETEGRHLSVWLYDARNWELMETYCLSQGFRSPSEWVNKIIEDAMQPFKDREERVAEGMSDKDKEILEAYDR